MGVEIGGVLIGSLLMAVRGSSLISFVVGKGVKSAEM